ncbi:hypothetical protein ETAA8_18590 [Anatilimnocola aggregata]|uniref:Uncharacterized protein n=1 Tax=Anatilimnocola aggregata TaxID=2528021 RepID=A0A517Y959_9BACT|nr:hypothetical protein [Anatilimnocola aggregata]QDU26777.1 hypothetical protein ETAA8_18590 [Anatilimnocola aggregata]
MDSSPLEIAKQFVAGEISPEQFRDLLYSDDRFEELLTTDPNLKRPNYVLLAGSAYHFVISQDFGDVSGILNAQRALCDFFKRNQIEYEATDDYSDLHDVYHDAQPKWLQVDSHWISKNLMPLAEGRKGRALQHWLKEELHQRFRFASKAPKWLRSPNWPIGPNGPLVFLGQVKIEDYFPDKAAAYVFYDPVTRETKTIIQL